jgi:hypothetical protein
MIVWISWCRLDRPGHPGWVENQGLYAYTCPDDPEILYIGKVDGTTVRQRWKQHRDDVLYALELRRGISEVSVLFGDISLENRNGLTRELLADIESLLIVHVRPWGNIRSRRSRVSRPGLKVICEGEWPLERREFLDRGWSRRGTRKGKA